MNQEQLFCSFPAGSAANSSGSSNSPRTPRKLFGQVILSQESLKKLNGKPDLFNITQIADDFDQIDRRVSIFSNVTWCSLTPPSTFAPTKPSLTDSNQILVITAANRARRCAQKIPAVDNLVRTGRLFNGFLNDIRRRYPWYLRDYLSGLNFTCLAAVFFMFFAVLTVATSFGALMATKTGGLMGVEEVLISTSLCGIAWALFACQPLLVLGMCGPVMVFEVSLYNFCVSSGTVDYLCFRFWITLWVVLYVVMILCFDWVGNLIRIGFKRFVEDVWTALLALIYVYESITRTISNFNTHPTLNKSMYVDTWNQTLSEYRPEKRIIVNATNEIFQNFTNNFTTRSSTNNTTTFAATAVKFLEPNTALFSFVLLIGTFSLAMYLKEFRNSHWFGKTARRCMSDYGVPISIFLFALLANLAPNMYVEKIAIPIEVLQVTSPQLRGWFINPFMSSKGVMTPVWVYFAASVPAILILIILFLLIEVGELVVAKKERQLKRGSGYQFDLLLAALMLVPCALFGIPWMMCTVAPSVAHINAVTVFEKGKAPGDKPVFVEVKEQRVTSLAIFVLLLLVILFAQPILRLIPVYCLYGVFVYLGVNTLRTLQFTERLYLLLTPRKHHPHLIGYVQHVSQWKMHIFTVTQLAGLVLLLFVMESPISLFFPLFIAMLIPVRYAFNYFYTPTELEALDFNDRFSSPDGIARAENGDFEKTENIDISNAPFHAHVNGALEVAEKDFYEEARAPA